MEEKEEVERYFRKKEGMKERRQEEKSHPYVMDRRKKSIKKVEVRFIGEV